MFVDMDGLVMVMSDVTRRQMALTFGGGGID